MYYDTTKNQAPGKLKALIVFCFFSFYWTSQVIQVHYFLSDTECEWSVGSFVRQILTLSNQQTIEHRSCYGLRRLCDLLFHGWVTAGNVQITDLGELQACLHNLDRIYLLWKPD